MCQLFFLYNHIDQLIKGLSGIIKDTPYIIELQNKLSEKKELTEPLSGQKHVKGIMATIWGEAIKDINRATYMAYPRGLALSEAGWTEMKNRNWESFKNRMYPNLMNLMKEGVSIRVPFEIEQKLENY